MDIIFLIINPSFSSSIIVFNKLSPLVITSSMIRQFCPILYIPSIIRSVPYPLFSFLLIISGILDLKDKVVAIGKAAYGTPQINSKS